MNQGQQLKTVEETAEFLQVHAETVRRWIKAGRLKAYKPGLAWKIKPADIEAFLESSRRES